LTSKKIYISLIGFTQANFPEAILEVAPLLFGLDGSDEMPMNRDDAFIRLADDARSRICEITPGQLARFRKLPLIVDVREKEEFFRGHIGGAKHISRGLLEQKVCEIVPDSSSPIVVYCAGGNRGALAADTLQKMGYQNVFSLKGGLSGWLEAGGLVETSESD
jgi:phage shock protein E